jgi:hypothetical protein
MTRLGSTPDEPVHMIVRDMLAAALTPPGGYTAATADTDDPLCANPAMDLCSKPAVADDHDCDGM